MAHQAEVEKGQWFTECVEDIRCMLAEHETVVEAAARQTNLVSVRLAELRRRINRHAWEAAHMRSRSLWMLTQVRAMIPDNDREPG